VGPEVAPVSERALAVLTGERLLTGMRPDVTLEQPRPGECLAARAAFTRQRVRPDVHLESTQAQVELLAKLAREGLLRLALGGRAMELLMLRQAGVRRVGLIAVRARVPGRSGRRRVGRARASARAVLIDLCVHDRASGGATRG